MSVSIKIAILHTEHYTKTVKFNLELPPELIGNMKNVTIAKGERATFEIELTKGDALVRWFKDGKELQFSEHLQLAIDGKRQRLMVNNALPDDDGEYSCQVLFYAIKEEKY